MTPEVTQHQTDDGIEATAGSSRRTVLRAAGVGGAAAAVGLVAAACGSSSSNNASSGNNPPSATGGGASASASASSGGAGGTVLAKTSDVPVDGGVIVTADGGTVVTQPAAGTYKAFTAICTHMQCTVGQVSNNQIMCPCHNSVYSAMDGHVISGPAPAPLAAKPITVADGQISLKS